MRRLLLSIPVGLLGAAVVYGQGCESEFESRRLLAEYQKQGEKMTLTERENRWPKFYADALSRFPRDRALHVSRISAARYMGGRWFEDIEKEYSEKALLRPEDPLAQYLAAVLRGGTDTSGEILALERLKLDTPDFVWTYFELADLYSSGKSTDATKAAENVGEFYRRCPDSIDGRALYLLRQKATPETRASAIHRVRVRLEKSTEPLELAAYESLWGLEFRNTPVEEHPQLRERVREDLIRLSKVDPVPDARWLRYLILDGMKQSGASKEQIEALEERILGEFPHSREAYSIASKRWKVSNPEPRPDDPAEVWQAYAKAHLEVAEQWAQVFTGVSYMSEVLFEDASNVPGATEKARVYGERAVARSRQYGDGWIQIAVDLGNFYLREGLDPKRALELLEDTWSGQEKQRLRKPNDNQTVEEAAMVAKWRMEEQFSLASSLARAYRRAGIGAKAAGLRAHVEKLQPTDDDALSMKYAALAGIASAEGNRTDALGLYQVALLARPKPPSKMRGVSRDDLLQDAHEVWRLSGGSELVWELWSKPPSRKQERREGQWETPNKPLRPFELTDLTGKKWTSKSLEGKKLFINVWATWCGPCQAELPNFQKLYEKTKQRTDLVVFSLNIDTETGLVMPYLKERGYTFPALLAAEYIEEAAGFVVVPQNWVVDRGGVWRWQQLGFEAAEAGWLDGMLAKIESTR